MSNAAKHQRGDDRERQTHIEQSLPAIAQALRSVDYGAVTLNLRGGQIVLLEVTRRQRFETEEPDRSVGQE